MARDPKRYKEYQTAYKLAQRAKQPAKVMSFDEIGQRLGISGRYARMIYNRAMIKLKLAA